MKKLTVFSLALLSVLFMASCRGPKGEPGNDANVSSSTLTVRSTQWEWRYMYTDNDGNERGQYYVEIDYPAINSNVYNYGAVLVYMDVDGAWSQLPLTYYYVDGDFLAEASVEVATLNNGGVALFWTQSDFWKVRPDTHDFKIVAIEAAVYDSRSDVDYSNYEAVKAAFQLAD